MFQDDNERYDTNEVTNTTSAMTAAVDFETNQENNSQGSDEANVDINDVLTQSQGILFLSKHICCVKILWKTCQYLKQPFLSVFGFGE